MAATPVRLVTGSERRRPTRRVNFTIAVLNAARPPAKGRAYHHDAKTPGLCVMVTSKGAKTFYVRKRTVAGVLSVKIGRFPDWTIEQARDKAAEINAQIVKGEDLRAGTTKAHSMTPLGELWEKYKSNHLIIYGTPRTLATDESRFKTAFDRWKGKPIGEINHGMVQTLHRELSADRPITANRSIELLRRLYRFAAAKCRYKGDNPAEHIDANPEAERERFIEPHELAAFFKALEAEPNEKFRDFFKLALFTGGRRSNVEAMAWTDLNLEAGVWLIPGDQSKSKKEMKIHLGPPALEVLNRRKAAAKDSPFVFPSWSASGHIEEPKSVWKRILTAAKITDLRVHDLRRTLGSFQAAAGASLTVIGKSLGHQSIQATKIYARLNLDPVRASVNVATTAILTAAGIIKPEPAEPVKVKGKRKGGKRK